MNGYSPSTGDREGGAVNRQIRVFLRTSGDDGMHDGHSASPLLGPYPAYKPSVTLLDLNKHLRRFGLPISRSYCTQLWFVKDCGGYFGAGFTWMFIFVGEMLVLLVLLMKALSLFVVINGILSFGCAFLGFVAHCRAMFTDPVSCYFVSHLMSTSSSHPSFHHSFTKPLLHSSAPTSNPPTEHCIREVWNWIAYWSDDYNASLAQNLFRMSASSDSIESSEGIQCRNKGWLELGYLSLVIILHLMYQSVWHLKVLVVLHLFVPEGSRASRWCYEWKHCSNGCYWRPGDIQVSKVRLH